MKELSQKEVAEHLGLSEKTVEKHLRVGARLLAHYTRSNALMPRLPQTDTDDRLMTMMRTRMKMSTERTQAIEDEASAWLVRRDSGTGPRATRRAWTNGSMRRASIGWRSGVWIRPGKTPRA